MARRRGSTAAVAEDPPPPTAAAFTAQLWDHLSKVDTKSCVGLFRLLALVLLLLMCPVSYFVSIFHAKEIWSLVGSQVRQHCPWPPPSTPLPPLNAPSTWSSADTS